MVRKGATTTAVKTTTVVPKVVETKKRKSDDDKIQTLTKKPASPATNIQLLFEKYKDEENTMGPDGIEKFCDHLGLDPGSIQVLVLAWQMGAKKMGYFTREEFTIGLEKLKCYDLSTLKNELISFTKTIQNDVNRFSELYKFSFGFASESENKKNVDLATAAEMLELILPDGVHTPSFVDFLNTTKTMRSINKDQWVCFLEFTKSVKKDLSNYDHSEAWPLLFDQFVDYVKQL